MVKIEFIIPDDKLSRVVEATKFLFSIPQILNEETGLMENEFTDNQWTKEAWRRYIIAQVKRVEIYKAKEEVSIESDDSLLG